MSPSVHALRSIYTVEENVEGSYMLHNLTRDIQVSEGRGGFDVSMRADVGRLQKKISKSKASACWRIR